VFEDIILFRSQNHKINANINKKKGTKIIHIKSHFINIIDKFTIIDTFYLNLLNLLLWGKKRPIFKEYKNINPWGKSKSGSFYTSRRFFLPTVKSF